MAWLKRPAPDSEWVQMYRQGITTPKIATTAGVAETTVRYHLALAARLEPSIRKEHREATTVPPRVTTAGRRNLHDVLEFQRVEGRLPSTGGSSPRERALGIWLHRRRQEAAQETISPIYRGGLDIIPGWETPSTKRNDDEARWHKRLAEVSDYRGAGNDWPRHNKTNVEEERVLGVWLHVQRINHRKGELDADRARKLDNTVPGWRHGRVRSGGRRKAKA